MGLIDGLPGMAYRCRNEPQWPMEFVSAGAEELTGYAPDELSAGGGLAYGDLIHADDRERVWNDVQAALAARARFQISYRIRTASGETKWVWEQGHGVFSETGELECLEGFIIDVTERRRAEERSRRMFEASPMGMYVYELGPRGELVLVGANRAADAILRIEHAPLIGKTIEEAFPPLVATEVPERYREVAERGGAWKTDEIHYEHGGVNGAFEVHAFQTHPGQMAVMFQDVTGRKQLEEQVLRSQRMESVGRLAAGVAHDFNNMVTAVTAYAQLLLARDDLDESARSDLRQIQAAADRSANLAHQLLAFSRKQALELGVLSLNDLVEGMGKMLQRLIRDDIELTTKLEANLWNIEGDPSRLDQVLMNLVVNASDAMPEGGELRIETANVELRERYTDTHLGVAPGQYVLLSVSDTGIGMDRETASRIFEPFFTTKKKGEGTGLGLSTTYGIVTQHGGSIWVYSEPGEGTTFKVYLPRTEAEKRRYQAEALATDALHGSETILMVEDDERVHQPVRRVLEGFGYTVLAAANGEEALRLAQEHEGAIDLLLTDVMMPGISGNQLARKLGSATPGLKVLFMSGYAGTSGPLEKVLESGTAFIRKPFMPRELGQKVREVLDGPDR